MSEQVNVNDKLIITPESEEFLVFAKEIATKLSGLVSNNILASDLEKEIVIFVGKSGISIKLSENTKEKPVYIDFSSGQIQYRQKNSGTRKEAIARAVGLKFNQNLRVLDATAGLGGDSFILASLGAQMLMIERNPLIHLLLDDALSRALHDEKLNPIIKRMYLIAGDSLEFIENIEILPDVIYMDPMFPSKTKNSLSKKEMRLFREIAGKDEDAEILFNKALQAKVKRVVVKRPAKSPYMMNEKPEFSIDGKASRFDIYIKVSSVGKEIL